MLRASSVARSKSFCAGRNVAENQFLGGRAGQKHLDAAFQLALRHQIPVALGPLHRVAQGGQTAWNDRDLVDRIGVRQAVRDQGVALS